MIQPTEADIGRRVIYDPGVKGVSRACGEIVGLGHRCVVVLFDGADGPLSVISNLRWVSAKAAGEHP